MKIQEVKEAIQANIDREQIGIDVFEHLSKVFEPFEDKKISERMATALRKNLPAGFRSCYLKRIASLIQIVVTPEKYDDRLTFLLAYNSNPTFRQGKAQDSHSGFAYYNACHGEAARQRNQKRRELQSKAIMLAGLANTYEAAKTTADAARAQLSELVGYTMDIEIPKALGMWENNEY